jgi:hypothetical protein
MGCALPVRGFHLGYTYAWLATATMCPLRASDLLSGLNQAKLICYPFNNFYLIPDELKLGLILEYNL